MSEDSTFMLKCQDQLQLDLVRGYPVLAACTAICCNWWNRWSVLVSELRFLQAMEPAAINVLLKGKWKFEAGLRGNIDKVKPNLIEQKSIHDDMLAD